MTLDTPHGPITKFLKKCPKNAGKMRGKIIFSPFWCLIQKLNHNPGLHAKNQREISKNQVKKPPPLYGNVDIPLLNNLICYMKKKLKMCKILMTGCILQIICKTYAICFLMSLAFKKV